MFLVRNAAATVLLLLVGQCAATSLRSSVLFRASVDGQHYKCNPNPNNGLVCTDGRVASAGDWGACGAKGQDLQFAGRRYCPKGYYQCTNNYCGLHASECKLHPVKYGKEMCYQPIVCPANAVATAFPLRSFDDCKCRNGFVKEGHKCVRCFKCPSDSVAAVHPPRSFDDCKCRNGFVKEGHKCVRCFTCPSFSLASTTHPASFEDCRCISGYVKTGHVCKKAFHCPENSSPVGGLAWDFSGCKCDDGFEKYQHRCIPVFECPANSRPTVATPQSFQHDCECVEGYAKFHGACREQYHCPENSSPIFGHVSWSFEECKCDDGYELYGGSCGKNCAVDYDLLLVELAELKQELATAKAGLDDCHLDTAVPVVTASPTTDVLLSTSSPSPGPTACIDTRGSGSGPHGGDRRGDYDHRNGVSSQCAYYKRNGECPLWGPSGCRKTCGLCE